MGLGEVCLNIRVFDHGDIGEEDVAVPNALFDGGGDIGSSWYATSTVLDFQGNVQIFGLILLFYEGNSLLSCFTDEVAVLFFVCLALPRVENNEW